MRPSQGHRQKITGVPFRHIGGKLPRHFTGVSKDESTHRVDDAARRQHQTRSKAGAGLPAGVSPASSDRRPEAVLVAASGHINMGGQARTERLLSLQEIVRGADARPSGLRERPLPKTTHHEGWMTDLLPPRRPTASEQELAAMLLKVMVERA